MFEQQSRELAGILFAPLLLHTLLPLALLGRLLFFFIYLIQNILHHLVTDNHSLIFFSFRWSHGLFLF